MISAHWCLSPNFGDALTPWFIKKILKKPAVHVQPNCQHEHLVLAGSILNWCNEHAITWGTGLGSISDQVNPKTDIRATRGPISMMKARLCGAAVPDIIGDSGLVLPRLYKPRTTKRFELGFIPHYVDMYRVHEAYKSESGIPIINLLDTIEQVIDRVNECQYLASSSLHGLVLAQAYGIPYVWVKWSDSLGGDGMKFWDFYASIHKKYKDYPPEPLDLRDEPYQPKEWWLRRQFEIDHYDDTELWKAFPR